MTKQTEPPTAAFRSHVSLSVAFLAKGSLTASPDANGIEKYNPPRSRNDEYLGPTFQSPNIVLPVNGQLWEGHTGSLK